MTIDDIIHKLNIALYDDDLSKGEIENLLELLTDQENIKIRVLDFEYYNEERLENIKHKKKEGVISQDFEWAAICREEELKIQKYIELKIEFDIKRSGFYFEDGYVLYFYFGTEKNDKQIKEIIDTKK